MDHSEKDETLHITALENTFTEGLVKPEKMSSMRSIDLPEEMAFIGKFAAFDRTDDKSLLSDAAFTEQTW